MDRGHVRDLLRLRQMARTLLEQKTMSAQRAVGSAWRQLQDDVCDSKQANRESLAWGLWLEDHRNSSSLAAIRRWACTGQAGSGPRSRKDTRPVQYSSVEFVRVP